MPVLLLCSTRAASSRPGPDRRLSVRLGFSGRLSPAGRTTHTPPPSSATVRESEKTHTSQIKPNWTGTARAFCMCSRPSFTRRWMVSSGRTGAEGRPRHLSQDSRGGRGGARLLRGSGGVDNAGPPRSDGSGGWARRSRGGSLRWRGGCPAYGGATRVLGRASDATVGGVSGSRNGVPLLPSCRLKQSMGWRKQLSLFITFWLGSVVLAFH